MRVSGGASEGDSERTFEGASGRASGGTSSRASPSGHLDRREWLRLAGLGALAGLSGCGLPGLRTEPAAPRLRVAPAPVDVAGDRVIRIVTGLRPFRPSGFVLRAERMGEKTVIHDYGHGGGGVTLSWGTARIAVEKAPRWGERRAAVLGSGAVGLATAHLLVRRGWEVTVYARDLPPDTTSNVAPALWGPASVFRPDRVTPEFERTYQRAVGLCHREFQELVGRGYGVRWMDRYRLSQDRPDDPRWLEEHPGIYPGLELFGPGEHPFPAPYAQRWQGIMIETPVYLDALLREARIAGVRVVVREFLNRREVLALDEPVIFNCTGLGSRRIFGDTELTPVKGQLALLPPQPEVDYMVTMGGGLYMAPRSDAVVLGGTNVPGDWSPYPDPDAHDRMIRGHRGAFAEVRQRIPDV